MFGWDPLRPGRKNLLRKGRYFVWYMLARRKLSQSASTAGRIILAEVRLLQLVCWPLLSSTVMTQNCSWQIGAESLSHWGYCMWMGHYSFNFGLWCLLTYIRLFHMVLFSLVSRAAAWTSVPTHTLRPRLMKMDDSPSLVMGHRWTKWFFALKHIFI